MDISQILTDELTDLREQARNDKNFLLSDQIRIELDARGSYVFDTKEGQVTYHTGKGNQRKELEESLKRDIMYNAIFNSWLFTIRAKFNHNGNKIL